MLTDQQLALAAQAGDRQAFGELARRFQPRLMNYLRHRILHQSMAEDAIQETFLAAFQAINRFDARWQISTWLFTIARRKAGKLIQRTARSESDASDLHQISDVARTAERIAGDKEAHSQIWLTARNVLSHEQFTALWVYYVEGLDAKQTALVLGKSYASARAILARARHTIRPHLRGWQDEAIESSAHLSRPNATSVRFAA
ncbi:MAG: sigma-70 family RNA polymerase sigma factor [Pirellulales bacterium]|nr:sigma-70 family RNA polymerase sigma factor [Pirellulales bacterium]